MFEPAGRWRRVLRAGWLLVVGVVLAFVLTARWDEVAGALAGARAGPLAASALLAVAGVGMSGGIWRTLLAGLGSPLPARAAAGVFYVGQLGKYLPGGVWPMVAQIELGRDHAVPARVSFAAVALFIWVHAVTGLAVGAAGLAAADVIPRGVGLLAVPVLALLAPGLLERVLSAGLRLARREPLPETPGRASLVVATGWAALMWLCYGAHLGLAGAALGQAVPLALGAGAFALAWCVGFAVVIAPAGAGAREAAMIAVLLPVVAAGPALALGLVSRLLVTVADAVWGLAGLGARQARWSR